MVEKIILLNELNRMELIRLLNINNMNLEKLLDLKIEIKKELDSRSSNVDEVKFEDIEPYNQELSNKYNKLKSINTIDLIKLINIEDMDMDELLYFDKIVDSAISYWLVIEDVFCFGDFRDSLTLIDSGLCNLGKIDFIVDKDLIFGIDNKYNFYVGKIDENRKCMLFGVMRKGLPYDLSRDILVFEGIVTSDNKLDGFWTTGIGEVDRGIKKFNNMDNVYDYQVLYDGKINTKDLNISYIACSYDTNSLSNLLEEICETKKKIIKK